MTDTVCGFGGDRDEALVSYLYDEGGNVSARNAFEAHLATCLRCASDLAALRGVRMRLANWAPPEPKLATTLESSTPLPAAPLRSRGWWREVPAWAQVAAALLFLGVSAGIAHLDVRYDANGLSIRTGWSPRSTQSAASSAAPTLAAPVGTASQANVLQDSKVSSDAGPWRAELAAFENRLKTELHGTPPGGAAQRAAADAETLRRVRALIDDSEKRQQRELALRLGEAMRDVNAQRQADLVRVQSALGTVQNRLGVQVLKNTQQVQQMDYLIRTSQRQER